MFEKIKDIDFSLLVPDYIDLFEVFNETPQIPFNSDLAEIAKIDLKKVQDMGISEKREKTYINTKTKQQIVRRQEEEEEADPDWIEFDPEKETTKFFGHVMKDEDKLREQVMVQKEKKQAREEDRKKKAIEQAKKAALTTEQRDLIDSSKKQAASTFNELD